MPSLRTLGSLRPPALRASEGPSAVRNIYIYISKSLSLSISIYCLNLGSLHPPRCACQKGGLAPGRRRLETLLCCVAVYYSIV